MDWTGRGGGRSPNQPRISDTGSFVGRGKGRQPGQPRVPGQGGPGRGGGRAGSQPQIEDSGSFVGRGGGRAAVQPRIEDTGSFVGRGQGRAGAQVPIEQGNDYVGRGGGRSGRQPRIVIGGWITLRTNLPGLGSGRDTNRPDLTDPEGNFVFALEIDGIEIAHFTECSGLKTSTEIFEIAEGGVNDRVHKLPGQAKWENIVLRYGVTADTSLLGWRGEVLDDRFGLTERRNGAIVLKNNRMQVVRRYAFKEAWPVAWEGPSLSASGSELAVEMIEIAHHGLEIR